ncbi:MAG: twin-arginine translocase subunit TatC, partial [Gemmatimonadota bacterium]|nr:twin-arginine translocase subunit TatC [Gemmatimonadota bacterium]
YYIALPISIRFLMGLLTDFMTPSIEATRYLGFVIKLLLGFGLVFELPVVILILSALGLVTPAFLRARRRHAIVIITVVASFLSPGDVIAVTVLMMIPLIFLYEFSILLSVLVWRRREAREKTIHEVDPPSGTVASEEQHPVSTGAAAGAATSTRTPEATGVADLHGPRIGSGDVDVPPASDPTGGARDEEE